MEDFVPLQRSFFAHYLWAEERVFSRAEAWLDLVSLAAYQPHKRMVAGVLVAVERGGIVATERFLSDRWKWSRTKVRAFTDLLKSDGMISVKKDHETTVLILCNYEKYNTAQTGKRPQKNQRETTGEPPEDQREEGKDREEDSEAKASSPRGRPGRDEFDAYVTGDLGMTATDAEHVWNVWQENGWTRAQGGKRVAIKSWKLALNTWKTGNYFPSLKTHNPQNRNAHLNPTSARNAGMVGGGRSEQYAGVGRVIPLPVVKDEAA